MVERVRFYYQEKRVINVLYNANRPLTTTQVANKAEMAWVTADKYLRKLRRDGYVLSKRYGNAVYWKLNS